MVLLWEVTNKHFILYYCHTWYDSLINLCIMMHVVSVATIFRVRSRNFRSGFPLVVDPRQGGLGPPEADKVLILKTVKFYIIS